MRLKQARTANTLRSFTPVRTAVLACRGTFEIGFPAPTTQVSKCRGPIKSSDLEKLAAPQGFEPRYADPELMDRIGENPWFHADKSITYLQLKPARKHFDEVLKWRDLSHTVSKRTAHLRHTFSSRTLFS